MNDEEEQNPNDPAEERAAADEKKTQEKKDTAQKIIRVLTVVAYLISVSMAAIMLSLYYIFLWNPAVPSPSARIADPPQDAARFSKFRFAGNRSSLASAFSRN